MWKNNNLSITIFILFLLCLAGHSVAGWKVYNDEQRQHGPISHLSNDDVHISGDDVHVTDDHVHVIFETCVLKR